MSPLSPLAGRPPSLFLRLPFFCQAFCRKGAGGASLPDQYLLRAFPGHSPDAESDSHCKLTEKSLWFHQSLSFLFLPLSLCDNLTRDLYICVFSLQVKPNVSFGVFDCIASRSKIEIGPQWCSSLCFSRWMGWWVGVCEQQT